jgi:hypothetical protein
MYLNNGLETCQGGHEMIYRTLGSTGEKVSAIGGAGCLIGLENVPVRPGGRLKTLERDLELVTYALKV